MLPHIVFTLSKITLFYRQTTLLLLLAFLGLATLPAAHVQAAPLVQQTTTTTLIATQDVRLQAGSPDKGFNGYLWVATLNGHLALVQFDLGQLPTDATIDHADLVLGYTGNYTGTTNVEVGRVDGAWDENAVTWDTQPGITFGGPVQAIGDPAGDIAWDVTPLARGWQSGAVPNYGVALRGDGRHKQFYSTENHANGEPPRLVVTYTVTADTENAHPDLGDAPDSSNHHSQPNTAYPAAGVLGQFPTVWQVPAAEAAGPRHDNQRIEGILGEFISREREADQGPDQDGPNNIIRNAATGAIGDVADNDRGDDGWRNRKITFVDCRKQTLKIRISKAPNATLKKMYLNVWFDGNRDGDWADTGSCAADERAAGPAYEWIVQDYIVDMSAIAAGGFVDFAVDTERVFNSTEKLPHWMRFTLSETPTPKVRTGAYPDGRGPHPSNTPGSFQFGETEDVLQRPPLPDESEEPGTLTLEKRVITHGEPVDYPGQVTYQIRLRHSGGSAPISAQIRDQIAFPQHLLPHITQSGSVVYVAVTSPSGGAAPLEADLTYVDGDQPGLLEQLIAWDGTLQPDSEVLLSFDIHVHPYCPALLNTKTITNIARARADGGDPITAEASFTAKCPGYDADGGIDFEPNPIDPSEWTHVPWQGTVWNKHPLTVSLGIFQEVDDPNRPGDAPTSHALGEFTLAPGEKRPLTFNLAVQADESDDDLAPTPTPGTIGRLYFCIFVGEEHTCANAEQYPNLEGEIVPPVWVPAPEELGDAPDSTNHFGGVSMAAYPGVQANFPTVFDPATGADQGPKHHNPRPLHLGPQVSREAEADLGPDADGINNIWPPANTSDQDWFDDGAQLSNLANCQSARVDVRVAVGQAAVNWFGNNNRVAYLNVWLDSNHDGDWADGFTCVDEAGQNKAVVEHILIDYPVDVAALGVGLHNLSNIATDRIGWPAQGAQEARWVRFTLSEEPANKPLTFGAIQYGDGRGYAQPFRTGETEDYLQVLPGANGGEIVGGPDMALRMVGQIATSAGSSDEELRLKFDYINRGTQPATGAVLTFRHRDYFNRATLLGSQGQGIDKSHITVTAEAITVLLPDLLPKQSGVLLLRLGSLDANPVGAAAASRTYTLTARIDIAGDLNPADNSAATTIATSHVPLRLAASVDTDELLRKADTTCRNNLRLQGRGEAMALVDFYVNDGSNIQFQLDADGLAEDLSLTNLQEGRNLLWLNYVDASVPMLGDVAAAQAVRLYVNRDLPVDPITLLLTNSQGRHYHPPTLGWAHGIDEIDRWQLHSGESYTISIQSCVTDPNLSARLFLNDTLLSTLRDDDGDGLYRGSFTYDSALQSAAATSNHTASALRLEIDAGGTTQRFSAELAPVEQGTVRDRSTGQPLVGATVTALVDDGDGTYRAITATESNDAATQTSAADGAFRFAVANGLYQLNVVADGYQSYRTAPIAVDNGNLAAELTLTPQIDTVADHTIYITANGFQPALVTIKPDEVIAWINLDLAEHATISTGQWDSGQLQTGDSYKTAIGNQGTYQYQDQLGNAATLIVEDSDLQPGDLQNTIFLPVVQR